ncbi:hypothetical protein ACLMJK_004588 [Lecanora helva]
MVSHVERIIPLKDAKEHRFPYETAKASRLRLAVGKEVITEDYYLKHTLPVMVELHGLEHELSEPNFTKTKIIVMSMDENKTDLIGELCDIFDISDTVLNTMLMTLTNNSGSTELDVLELSRDLVNAFNPAITSLEDTAEPS